MSSRFMSLAKFLPFILRRTEPGVTSSRWDSCSEVSPPMSHKISRLFSLKRPGRAGRRACRGGSLLRVGSECQGNILAKKWVLSGDAGRRPAISEPTRENADILLTSVEGQCGTTRAYRYKLARNRCTRRNAPRYERTVRDDYHRVCPSAPPLSTHIS